MANQAGQSDPMKLNRLSKETSPYLLQHAANPVDWYPWGTEALERAKTEDRPILLSIGYAACHWCHVMAHESFEDEATAAVMNERFINIKVDREERPDLDGIYMQAVQALTGHGGWPMTMFLTPEGAPFYGGTYFPPQERQGMPSFTRVLNSVADAYANKRDSIAATSAQLGEIYSASRMQARSEGPVNLHTLDLAYRGIARRHDVRHGGFDGAPKFPQTMTLDFLLRYGTRTGTEYALEIAHDSFLKMARGGIYDQIGGGFHRYTVDAIWLVPHFEKMVYDNALLVRFGAHLWQATGDAEVKRVTEETVEWLAREMTSPEGGFFSSLDADSEGHEGKFYVWSQQELDAVLGTDSPAVTSYYGVTPGGNFEGANILNVRADRASMAARAGTPLPQFERTLNDARTKLYDVRAKRVWPGLDDKILAGWNGLMLRGLATAARAFENAAFTRLAINNGDFLVRELVRDGRVMRSHKNGESRIGGFLEDHAAVALGFVALYELTFDAVWIERATAIAGSMIEWFWDEDLGAFFDTARDAEPLITRPREVTDNAIPSGTSLAVDLLLTLSELRHDPEMRRRATFVIETLASLITQHPGSFGHLLGAADMAVHGAVEVAIAGDRNDRSFKLLEHEVASHYVPSLILAGGDDAGTGIALMEGREARSGKATAYVCRSYTCDEPATDPAVLANQLEAASRAPA